VSRKDLDLPVYLFHQGTNYRAQELLGAHPVRRGKGWATVFRVWAPHARSVSAVGDFNGWDRAAAPMKRTNEQGIWECTVKKLERFALYKYSIETADAPRASQGRPLCVHAEHSPEGASRYYPMDGCYDWKDASWLEERAKTNLRGRPGNIYELHAG
jgi:1,4-alpha-glucan branching enzyme